MVSKDFRAPQKEINIASIILRLLLLSAAVILSASCKKCQDPPPANAVTVGLEGSFGSLDPRYGIDAYSVRAAALVYNGLVRLDENAAIIPDLALSWSNPDDRTYIFKLRTGVKFHDGSDFGPEDVKYTFEFIANRENASPKMADFSLIESIEIIAADQLKITLSEPLAPFLTACSTGIVPEGAAADDAEPPGTGPYRLTEKKIGDYLELSANPTFFSGKPEIDKIIMRVIPEGSTRVLEMEKGSIDLLQNSVPIDSLELLEENPNVEVIDRPGISYSYLGFNLDDPILSNPDVRRAIAYAIDRDKLIKHLLKGRATPATGLLPPSNWAYEPNVELYPFTPTRAAELLDRAGYPDPDGDGPQSRFKLQYKTSTNRDRRRIADAIGAMLGDVGIEVEVRGYEWATFFDDVKSGNFQLYSLTWVGVTEPDIYHLALSSDMVPPAGANRNRFRNGEFDRLTAEARTTIDIEKRKELYSKIQKIAAEQLPYVSLWHNNNIITIRPRLVGFRIMPEGSYYSLATAHLEWPQ